MSISIKRLLAGIIDFYIICFISSLLVLIVTLGEMNISIISVLSFLLSFFIMIIFKDVVWKNASIGKKIFKLIVVNNESTETSNNMIVHIKRNVTLLLLPIEVILIIVNNRRIGDIFANTSVIQKPLKNII